jgi:hypothetical protein
MTGGGKGREDGKRIHRRDAENAEERQSKIPARDPGVRLGHGYEERQSPQELKPQLILRWFCRS